MIELAEIFRRHGPAYREKHSQQLLPSQRRALADIELCRTEALGGHLYLCDQCGQTQYSYHSCKNRHCPKCQNDAAQHWLRRQQALLLPVSYFMVTFTLPEGLRALAYHHQKQIYHLLFQTSAAALQELALDPRFVGGQIGMVGVLQTWTRDLRYHPHVHYLLPGGGLSADGQIWYRARNAFFVHVKPLSRLFRAKFHAALKRTELLHQVASATWRQEWVVHCQPVNTGEAALKYLAPYVFRVALSNNRLLKLTETHVTFRYRDATRQTKIATLPGETFIQRFLQHVLPKGFQKVRYYGLFSPTQRSRLQQVRRLLSPVAPTKATEEVQLQTIAYSNPPSISCPACGRPMRHLQTLRPVYCRSP